MPKAHFYKDDTSESTDKIKQGIVLSLDLVRVRWLLLESSDVILLLKREERYFKKSLLIPLYERMGTLLSFSPERERL